MTNRQQSAFFLAIVFLFTSGIGLVIYRQYDQYYQQKAAIDLEAASTTIPAKKISASASSPQTKGWKTYKNSQYGFEFLYPPTLKISYDTMDFNNISSADQPIISISSPYQNTGLTVRIFKPFDWSASGYPSSTVTVDSLLCQKNVGQDVEVLCHKGSYDYGIDYGLTNSTIIDEILSTFKFTN